MCETLAERSSSHAAYTRSKKDARGLEPLEIINDDTEGCPRCKSESSRLGRKNLARSIGEPDGSFSGMDGKQLNRGRKGEKKTNVFVRPIVDLVQNLPL